MDNLTAISEILSKEILERISQSKLNPTLSEIERTSRKLLQEIGRTAIEKAVQAHATLYPEEIYCEDGHQMEYVRKRSIILHTVCGSCEIRRPYYVCPVCKKGKAPLDEKLKLRPNQHSAELEKLLAMTGVLLPYGKGRDLFHELMLIDASDPSFSKATIKVGELVMEQEEKEKVKANSEAYLLETKRNSRPPLRLYGSIDAVKVLTREAEGPKWRDLKVGAWYTARGKPPKTPDGEWKIEAEGIHYYADIAPAKRFGELVWGSGVKHLAHLSQELIIIGDGAEWIWNIAGEQFPKAIQILDWFHATQYLTPVAQAAFKTIEKQDEWVSSMKKLMWDGKIDLLIETCQELEKQTPHTDIETSIGYFINHKERMNYGYYRSQGYQIGSGTIESAAKQLGLMRMKVPGASWKVENACKVAKARAAYLSDQWESLPLAV